MAEKEKGRLPRVLGAAGLGLDPPCGPRASVLPRWRWSSERRKTDGHEKDLSIQQRRFWGRFCLSTLPAWEGRRPTLHLPPDPNHSLVAYRGPSM